MFAADWRHRARSGARQYVVQPPASISEYWMTRICPRCEVRATLETRREHQFRCRRGGRVTAVTASSSDQRQPSPRIAHDALAGVAAGHVGDLDLDVVTGRLAVQPFHFG